MTLSMMLDVLTPDKKVLETPAQSIQVLLPDGWWGILPGHAPMISYIEAGILHYTQSDATRYVAFYQGTIEVQRRLKKGKTWMQSHQPWKNRQPDWLNWLKKQIWSSTSSGYLWKRLSRNLKSRRRCCDVPGSTGNPHRGGLG